MSDSEYSALIAELQVEYLKSFPEKFQKIQALRQDKDWNQMELEFHKLKGTGKTYGVPEVSEVCREMERICRQGEDAIYRGLPYCMDLLAEIQMGYQQNNKLAFEIQEDSRYILLTEVSQ